MSYQVCFSFLRQNPLYKCVDTQLELYEFTTDGITDPVLPESGPIPLLSTPWIPSSRAFDHSPSHSGTYTQIMADMTSAVPLETGPERRPDLPACPSRLHTSTAGFPRGLGINARPDEGPGGCSRERHISLPDPASIAAP